MILKVYVAMNQWLFHQKYAIYTTKLRLQMSVQGADLFILVIFIRSRTHCPLNTYIII